LAEESLTRHPFKHWVNKLLSLSPPPHMHTDRISNSVMLGYYVLFPSDLCACVQVKKTALQMKP